MRRAPFVAGATILGLAGIMTFHSQNPISSALVLPKSQAPAKSPAATATTTSTGHPAPTSTPTSAPTSTAAPATTSTSSLPPTSTSGSTSTSTSTSTAAPATTAAPAIRTATGPTENYGYGTLAVEVTVNGTKITDVSTPGHYEHAQYSQQLAAQVLPMLRSEVLQAQSANINGISGASYTSQAYASSLQAVLDQLHVP